jgi:hypothetical protein
MVSGGDRPQFEKQVFSSLPHDQRLASPSLHPTCGTKFCRYSGEWKNSMKKISPWMSERRSSVLSIRRSE